MGKLKAIYDGEPFSNGGKTILRKGRSLKRGMQFVVDLARLPRVKYFRVVKVSLGDSVTKYAVLLKPTGGKDMDSPGGILEGLGLVVKYDVFDTMDMARKMGFAIKMTWGRGCTRDEHVKMALSMLVSA